MVAIFECILDMSIAASWLIVAVVLIRFLVKRAPKEFRYVLWAMVAFRLLCPVVIESDLSLIPDVEIKHESGEIITPTIPMSPGGEDVDDSKNDDAIKDNNVHSEVIPNTKENFVISSSVLAGVWVGGSISLMIYAIVSYLQLRKTVRTSINSKENIWICDEIQSPFILGLIHPKIYLPSYIAKEHVPYIIAHEKEHIRLKDHWWKLLGFVLLIVHWFNPLVWVAYILMCRDIEIACDERVIRDMNITDKKEYSKSLLLCSSPRHYITACPVAFGEVGVKERIMKITDYRKPSFWILGICIVICGILAVGYMTDPKENPSLGQGTESTEEAGSTDNLGCTENTETVGQEQESESVLPDNYLTKEELNWFATEFFNREDDRMPNMFLTSEYSLPGGIDLYELFYNGADGFGGNKPISEDEKRLLLERHYEEIFTDIVKITPKEMDEVLQKYMSRSLDETAKNKLNYFVYLEEYDAYYLMAGDTNYTLYEFDAGWRNEENGSISLQYHDALQNDGCVYWVTLKEMDGSYYFFDNMLIKKE